MKFLRREYNRYKKLSRKKKLKWRRPTGRDNKMREKRRGYAKTVSIGYKKEKRIIPIVITNLAELEKVKKTDIVVLGKIGRKNKIAIVKKAQEKKIELQNVNMKKFLEKTKLKEKPKEEKKETKEREK